MRSQIRRQTMGLGLNSLKQAFWGTHVGGLLVLAILLEVLARKHLLHVSNPLLLMKVVLFLYALVSGVHVWRRASLMNGSVYAYYARTFSFVIAWIFAYDIVMMLYKLKFQESVLRMY